MMKIFNIFVLTIFIFNYSNILIANPKSNIIEEINIREKQNKDLILITSKGTFIKHNTKEIKISKKGELGTIGINFKNNKEMKDRVINCFLNNKYVFIKTNQERYEKLETEVIDISSYNKEKNLKINLNENEFIETIFSMVLPENN